MDNNEKLKNEVKYRISVLKINNESKCIKKEKFNKKAIIAACATLVLSTGVVFAKDINNYFSNLFNNSNKAIDVAVENGYVQQIDTGYTYDKDIGIKVENLVLDDLNLDISFNFETKKENIKSIRLNNFIITNDNDKVVFRSEFKSVETPEELPIYNSFSWSNAPVKLTETTFADSILFGLRPEREDFKVIYFDVKSLQLIYMDDSTEIIDGSWLFSVTINDEMRKNTKVIYNMLEDNEYIENCTLTMSNTGAVLELNSKVEIPDIIHKDYGSMMLELIYIKSNEKIYKPRGVEFDETYMKANFEDLSNYIENSEKIELHLDFFDTTIILTKEEI